jgi:branched-chain amino acid transport system permease protein
MWGAFFAAPVLWGLPLLLPPEVASWRVVIYGVLLVAVLVIKPEGIITKRLVYKVQNLLDFRKHKKINQEV